MRVTWKEFLSAQVTDSYELGLSKKETYLSGHVAVRPFGRNYEPFYKPFYKYYNIIILIILLIVDNLQGNMTTISNIINILIF